MTAYTFRFGFDFTIEVIGEWKNTLFTPKKKKCPLIVRAGHMKRQLIILN